MKKETASDYRVLLTDTALDRPVHLLPWSLYAQDLAFEGMPAWSVRRRPLHGGKQEGLDIITLDNGCLSVDIVPGRGMNVYRAFCDGVRLGWDNPIGQLVHPSRINPGERGGTGWLEGFNEFICRCGLENTGGPCRDEIIDDGGNSREVNLFLHGNISNSPASRVWFQCQARPPFRLTVGGEVRDARMFGPSWLLRTEISTEPGSAHFRISDEIINLDDSPCEMELLYHCNFGTPLLEEGSTVVAPVRCLSANNARSLEGIENWNTFAPPTPGFVEQCYLATLRGDAEKRSTVALVNQARDMAAWLEFDLEELPFFTLWKRTGSLEAGYVAGLEPGTDYPNPRPFEREKGRVLTLAPGESRRAEIRVGLKKGKKDVEALCRMVKKIPGSREKILAALNPEMVPGV